MSSTSALLGRPAQGLFAASRPARRVRHRQAACQRVVAFTEHEKSESEMGHEAGNRMLQATRQYLQMFVDGNTSALHEVASETLRLHADGAILERTLQNRDAVERDLGTFFAQHDIDNFSFLATGVNTARREVFGLVKFDGAGMGDIAAALPHVFSTSLDNSLAGGRPFTRLGIEKLVFNEDCSKIEDIYFFRQLTPDETYHVVSERLVPEQKLMIDDPMLHYHNETISAELQRAMIEAARVYLSCWTTGEFGEIEQVMDENVHFVEGRGLWLDREIWGSEAYVLGVINAYKHMYKINVSPISFCPAIKHAQVFVHYKLDVTDRASTERAEVDVLELLCFDHNAKITGIINMRQPLPWDAKHYIRK